MAKALLVAIVLGVTLATTGWAATTNPSLIATPPQPTWSELTVQQRIVLAPISDDWDSLENPHKKKWLSIVTRFSKMTEEEQRSVQMQMQEWAKLTPEQREKARQNYKAASQLPTEKKQELKQKWEEYSSLPEAEKEKLKRQAASNPVPKPGRSATSGPPFPLVPLPEAPGSSPPVPSAPVLSQPATETPPAIPSAPVEATEKP